MNTGKTLFAHLLKPEFKGEIQMANAASSGTSYTVIATLVLWGMGDIALPPALVDGLEEFVPQMQLERIDGEIGRAHV